MGEQNENNYEKNGLTSDFQPIIKIARWNYIGIAFIDFLLPFFSKEILNATATEIGFLLSSTILGVIVSSFITGLIIKKTGSQRLMVSKARHGAGKVIAATM